MEKKEDKQTYIENMGREKQNQMPIKLDKLKSSQAIQDSGGEVLTILCRMVLWIKYLLTMISCLYQYHPSFRKIVYIICYKNKYSDSSQTCLLDEYVTITMKK